MSHINFNDISKNMVEPLLFGIVLGMITISLSGLLVVAAIAKTIK